MSFFELPPRPSRWEDEPPDPPWFGAPVEVMPAVLALDLVLARTDEAVAFIPGLEVVHNGFVVQVRLHLRRAQYGLDPLYGDPYAEGGLSDHLLRFGLQFADGRKVTNLDEHPGFEEQPDGPVLVQGSGGGGRNTWAASYWVWPLPPPGPLQFVVEWPAFGVDLVRHEIEAARVHETARRAVELWPPEQSVTTTPASG